MLLEILGTLESLAAEIALVRFQRDVNANVGSNVVALDSSGAAIAPLTGQIQIVRTLTTDMALADMILQKSQRTG
jgi:hypothetical protein